MPWYDSEVSWKSVLQSSCVGGNIGCEEQWFLAHWVQWEWYDITFLLVKLYAVFKDGTEVLLCQPTSLVAPFPLMLPVFGPYNGKDTCPPSLFIILGPVPSRHNWNCVLLTLKSRPAEQHFWFSTKLGFRRLWQAFQSARRSHVAGFPMLPNAPKCDQNIVPESFDGPNLWVSLFVGFGIHSGSTNRFATDTYTVYRHTKHFN